MSKLELLARDGRMSMSVGLIGAQLNNARPDNPARPLARDFSSHYRADKRFALCAPGGTRRHSQANDARQAGIYLRL
jgi:hypothetical protein